MKRRLPVFIVTVGTLALLLSGAARADSTLGTTVIPASTPDPCNGQVIAQATSDPSAPYNAPGPGTINQWKVYAGPPSSPGASVTFVVLKPAAGFMTVVGSNTQTLPTPAPTGDVAFTIAAPIAVTGGETLGLWTPANNFVCYLHGAAVPAGNTLAALTAPTAPAPGQALPVSALSPGGYRMNLSANFVPSATKKKCKKKKKHKSSVELAKKKKCKKKKKKG